MWPSARNRRARLCRTGRLGLALAAVCLPLAGAGAETIVGARFTSPTDRYRHDVLGRIPAFGGMEIRFASGARRLVVLPQHLVFEDIAPRLADVDGDGAPEVVAVEAHLDKGARLAIHGTGGRVAATPFIGRAHRWLAPAGIADLDGDGRVEIAYVDRPHLARILRIWRLEGGRLRQVATHQGVTNHRIGEERISGGVRDCGKRPELVLASADWQRLVALRLAGGRIVAREIAPPGPAGSIPAAFDRALACRD